MKNIITAIQRGVKAARETPARETPEPQKFQAAGKTISCSHCGKQGFVRYELEKTVARGLLHELWGLQCSKCGHLEFFAQWPAEIEDES
jgi:hypothetical protein